MWRRGALLLIPVLAACVRAPRVEQRERPVETGLLVPFVSDASRTWDFGDGSPVVTGAQVQHAFSKAGRYTVRGRDGAAVREEISLVVASRSVLHLVPPDAEFALLARGLEELAPAVDFVERLGGATTVQDAFDANPALWWSVEQSLAGGAPLDAREGFAVFTWPDVPAARVTATGIVDDAAALAAFSAWLAERGWSGVSTVQGLLRFEREARSLDVFVDRGALYAVETALTERVPSAQSRVAAASALGLEADGSTAALLDALPAGGLVVYGVSSGGASWKVAAAALRFTGDEARAEGTLFAGQPLWAAAPVAAHRLLKNAPDGPVAAFSGMLGAPSLAALLLGPPGSPRRTRAEEALLDDGVELTRLLETFAGGVDAVVYADVEGFVRDTLAAGGRPQPQGSLLVQAGVRDAAKLEVAIDALTAKTKQKLLKEKEQQLRLWRGAWAGRPFDLVLTDEAFFVKAGAPVDAREPIDLMTKWGAQFDGAFGEGHLSALVDVGQLRRELLQPRLMDIDPRKSLTAQALAVTMIDRLTRLELAMVDLSPTPQGATVQAVLRLRPREVDAER